MKLPKAAFAAAIIIVICESLVFFTIPLNSSTVRFYKNNYPAFEDSIVQWQVHRILNDRRPADVIFLGDSSCLMGIAPSVITEHTGLAADNLGTLGWLGIRGHARLLDLYLRNHPPPRLMVYYNDTYVYSATASILDQVGMHKSFENWLDTLERSEFSIPTLLLRTALLQSLTRYWLRADQLRGQRGPYPSDAETYNLLLESRGHLVDPRQITLNPGSEEPVFVESIVPDFQALIRVASTHHIRVLIALNTRPNIVNNAVTVAGYLKFEQAMKLAIAGIRGVQIIEPLLSFLPDEDFATGSHLAPSGAKKTSLRLAEAAERFLKTRAGDL